jgi:hypothetical protein
MGTTNVAIPIAYKWLMIGVMTIVRGEILTILIALIPISVKNWSGKAKNQILISF